MTSSPRRFAAVAAATLFAVTALAGCVAKADVASGTNLTVTSTDDACSVSGATTASGPITFTVSNESSKITEFYVLASDGLRIVGEVENIAPGASRTLSMLAQPGDYFTLCKPGMIGAGVDKTAFSVTGEKVELSGDDAALKQEAVDLYVAFVKDQVGQLVPEAETFVADYVAGNDDAARAAFPLVRAYYERIEPIAEALGDLDPRIDYREVDAVAEGLAWTGFHRIEKDLWVPAQDALNADEVTPAWQDWAPSTPDQRAEFAQQLTADISELYDYVHSADFATVVSEQGVAGLSNGAIALLDEVATGKIQGEEDWWSGTDLYDFAANVEGSKMAFSLVREFAVAQGDDGAQLAEEIDRGYTHLQDALAVHGSLSAGFVTFTDLSDQERRELTDLLNALAEPLSQLTATILE